jgi:hypothetical protein
MIRNFDSVKGILHIVAGHKPSMFLNDELYTDAAVKDPAALSQLPLFSDTLFRRDTDNTRHLKANPSIAARQGKDFQIPFSRDAIQDSPESGRSYEEFLKKYDNLSPEQKERTETLINRIVFSALQFQEWGTMHHAKMMDRHAWHYYIDNGSFPEEYPMPHFAWMDGDDMKRLDNRNDNEAREERFKHVIEHLKHPDASTMTLPKGKMPSPKEAHLVPWQFDEQSYTCDAQRGVFELPFPHELGLSDVTREHSEQVYTLRHKLRTAISQIDDQEVVNAVFSHPDVRDNVSLLQFYAGQCEGEQERYFERKAHEQIGRVLEQGFGHFSDFDLSKLGLPSSEDGLLPFHQRAFGEVSHTVNENLSQRQKERYLDITDNEPVDLEAIARKRLGELLTNGEYDGQLSKKDKLAVLIGLLGEYGYSENYTLLAANELNFIEQSSIRRDLEGKQTAEGVTYGPDTVVAFPGAGSLPLSAIFKHVMTDAPMVLIDIDPDAVTRAREFIGMLEHFGVVTPGKLICAAPSSAETYFDGVPSKAEPMTEGYFAGKLGKDGRMLAADRYDEPLIKVVELASLLPEHVKYQTMDAVAQLPRRMQPDAVMSRTTFGKATGIYDKIPRLPMCLSYDYKASATPKTITGDNKMAGPSIEYYNDKPLTQVSAAHLFLRPGLGEKHALPIFKKPAHEIPAAKILEQEADVDAAYGALRRQTINLLNRSGPARLYQSMGFALGGDTDEPAPPQAEPDWSSRRLLPLADEPSWIKRRNDVSFDTSLRPGS